MTVSETKEQGLAGLASNADCIEKNADCSERKDAVREKSVDDMATIRDGIDLSRENVIAIFGKPDDLKAILLRPDGRIKRVKVGDLALGGRVKGIDATSVVIQRRKKTTVVSMPEI